MDPFVATLLRQAAVLGLAVGLFAAALYFAVQYPKLQHALTLNMTPPKVQ
jgi:hypothetical protein